jgi:CBS domain-containing protein
MTLKEAATLMRDGDFNALPVSEQDRVIGLVTDRDIMIRAVATGKDPSSTAVREVMSERVWWSYEDTSIEEAARTMREHQIRRMPVFNRDERLVGIVSMGDLTIEGFQL